jgi:FkbM family methyltransferase
MVAPMNEVDYIFDFGANAGQNLDYYLSRAKKVIAVEANPKLCHQIQKEFKEAIDSNRLTLENVAITSQDELSGTQVDFFIQTNSSVHSQLDIPQNMENFERIKVLSMTATQIVRKHLVPSDATSYIKIDLEGFDSQVLRDLFRNQIYPENISAESHTIETFTAFIETGVYKSFTLIDGNKVPNYKWESAENTSKSFRRHSAGPFGRDIVGKWFEPDAFYQLLALERLGWKDIHASKLSKNCERKLDTNYLILKLSQIIILDIYRLIVPSGLRKKFSKLRQLFAFSKLRDIYKISRIKHVYNTIFRDLK